MTTWIVSGWVHLVLGFLLGWLLFKRPDIITRRLTKITDWFRMK